MITTAVIPVMYGEIPEHVKHTFQLSDEGTTNMFGYTVVREGGMIPDTAEQFIILHGDNDSDRNEAYNYLSQIRTMLPGKPILVLEVRLEEPINRGLLVEWGKDEAPLVPDIWAQALDKSLRQRFWGTP